MGDTTVVVVVKVVDGEADVELVTGVAVVDVAEPPPHEIIKRAMTAMAIRLTLKRYSAEGIQQLQHLGYAIPPQADAAWLGEAGPGPSYLDEGSGGPDSDFTNRNTTFMTRNLLHFARMLKDAGGVPAHGKQRSLWDAGCRFDFVNPEYR